MTRQATTTAVMKPVALVRPKQGRGGELTREAFIGYHLLDIGDRRRDVPRCQKYRAADDDRDNGNKNKFGKIFHEFP